MKKKKNPLVIFCLCSALVLLNGILYADQQIEKNAGEKALNQPDSGPFYIPGELIVHMKENYGVDDIKELNEKHGVISVKKLFRETATPEEKLQGLQRQLSALNPEHSQWYWQLSKDSQEYKDLMRRMELQKQELEKKIEAQLALLERIKNRRKRAAGERYIPKLDNIYILKVGKDKDLLKMAEEYSSHPLVEQARPNYMKKLSYIPTDPLYVKQWAHKETKAEEGWDIEKGSSDIIIAILDTGVDYRHEDLAANIWHDPEGNPGIDFVDLDEDLIEEMKEEDAIFGYVEGEDYSGVDNDPCDWEGHGTHCAGIAGAVGENNLGVVGAGYNCKIMPVRVGYAYTRFSLPSGGMDGAALVNGVKYAVDNGADIISMSFGGDTKDYEEEEILNYAASEGVILVAAAGNDNSDSPHYPSSLDAVISVGATAKNDAKASYSNYGKDVDLAAPGGDHFDNGGILSTVITEGYGLKDPLGYGIAVGTSMAAPYIAGVAGLCVSHYPNESATGIRRRITATADELDPDLGLGTGRVNVSRALKANAEPYFRFKSAEYEELEGNKNLIIDGEEKIKLTLSIDNLWLPAEVIKGTLSSDSISISSISDSQAFFDKDASLENRYTGSFIFETAPNIEIDTQADFSLTINADGCSQTLKFSLYLGIRKISESKDEDILYPFVDEKRCVYVRKVGGIRNIFLYDFEKNKEEQITEYFDPSVLPACLSISGEKLVWCDDRYGNYDIYLYDFEEEDPQKRERRITNAEMTESSPHIDGNKIVYLVSDSQGSCAVYLYDLAEEDPQKRNIRISSEEAMPGGEPWICGERVVWHDRRSGDFDIYMCDLRNKKERVICSEPGTQVRPRVYGDRIVWVDYRNAACESELTNPDDRDIYLYDLEKEKEFPLCVEPHGQNRPFIFGDWVVWADCRNGDSDIYLCKLDEDYSNLSCKQITKNKQDQKDAVICESNIVWVDSRSPSGVYLSKMENVLPMYYPEITAVSPEKGGPGCLVTITGSNLGSVRSKDNYVSFGGVKDDFIVSWSDNRIECSAPLEAGSWEVTVNTKYGVSNPALFSVNNPPVFVPLNNKSVREEEFLTFTVYATDDDNDNLTYSVLSMPYGANFDAKSGTFSWKPGWSLARDEPYTATFRVRDAFGGFDTQRIEIKVINVNQKPKAYIDIAGPNPAVVGRPAYSGQRITFCGHGVDRDGSIEKYEWSIRIRKKITINLLFWKRTIYYYKYSFLSRRSSFSITGLPASRYGAHKIYFRVRDNEGRWSNLTMKKLTIVSRR